MLDAQPSMSGLRGFRQAIFLHSRPSQKGRK